jgi:short-subunit dehydrogenase
MLMIYVIGITNPPGNPAYNASKAAVKALAEHLSYDLKDSGVGVHLLVPGWTFTGLVSIPFPSFRSLAYLAFTPSHTSPHSIPSRNIIAMSTNTLQSGNVPGSSKDKPAGAWSAAQVVEYMYNKMSEGKFYIICPDNDVSEETDKKRMLWSVGDVVNGRPPLTRWRGEYKQEAEEWMAQQKF